MELAKPSLSQWVEDFTPELYSWALHKVSNAELAADLVQDTFLTVAEKIDSFKGNSAPKTWIFSILNHKIIDHYRKKINHPVNIENDSFSNFFESTGEWIENKKPMNWYDGDEGHLLDNVDFQKIMEACMNALPEKWSTCIKLKYLVEKNGEEICQELDITSSNFWQIVHRAKLQLRDCIEQNWHNY